MDTRKIAADLGSNQALTDAAAKAGIRPEQAEAVVQTVLEEARQGGHSGQLPEKVAGKLGLSTSQIQSFLPQVMPLLQAHATTLPAGAQSELGEVVSAVGGFLSS